MSPDGATLISVIIPAYNEEMRLPIALQATIDYFQNKGEPFEILVVDDGSSDGTPSVVSHFNKLHPDVNLRRLEYGGNRGKGYAVRFGMLAAVGSIRLFCDADLATPIEEYDVVYKAMSEHHAQVGIGSRPLKNSHLLVREPWYRELLGRLFNKLVQAAAVRGIQDTQCGFKLFNAESAEAIFSICAIDGFAFDAEVLYIAQKLGYAITEVPIRWAHKDGSKISMVRDGYSMLCELSRVRYLHRGVRPRKAVLPNV
jgi:dolichyl-phosphate beta-glucosyltransferase